MYMGMIDIGFNVNMMIDFLFDCDGGILEYSCLNNMII